eukprot:COSAG03_NODE_16336_length_405_cov_0.571895_1_plen_25_part_01
MTMPVLLPLLLGLPAAAQGPPRTHP